MKLAFFDAHNYERHSFGAENERNPSPHQITFFETRLVPETLKLARGYEAICVFVNDQLNAAAIDELAEYGVKLIALRSAGFNNVDLVACAKRGITVVRVPAYSPHAVAEHALAMILSLNRKIHRAYQRVRELNFSLEGLVGFDLHGKTVGVIGTGKIGAVFAKNMAGLGCSVVAYDKTQNDELKHHGAIKYLSLEELYRVSDIISLHVPLTPQTRHLIDDKAIAQMKSGVMLINTGRGALIDTKALVEGLKSEKIGSAGLDVYEEEEGIFFFDLSDRVLHDDLLARLLTFPNVLITAHQGFLTHEALANIAKTTLDNLSAWEKQLPVRHQVRIS